MSVEIPRILASELPHDVIDILVSNLDEKYSPDQVFRALQTYFKINRPSLSPTAPPAHIRDLCHDYAAVFCNQKNENNLGWYAAARAVSWYLVQQQLES